MDKKQAEKRIKELRKIVEYHAKKYYDEDKPEISDFEYDMLMVELRNLEKEYPEYQSKESLTQKVGGHVKEGFQKVTKKSIETAVAFLYGSGINQPGNSVIIGHNYRNGLFFSNNKKLNIGDKIYITGNDGKKVTYTIYNKFEATPEDTSFYQRDTGGKAEVTLSTCTDDSKARLIICAKAE